MNTTIIEPNDPSESLVSKTIRLVVSRWWLLAAAGLLLLSIGIWVIRSPFQSYLTLSKVFAMGMIGTGLSDIFLAVFNKHSKRRIWWLLAGIADIVIGIYLFNNILFTIILMPLVIGLWTLYRGVIAIGDVFHLRDFPMGNWHHLLIVAIAAVVMALFLLACPYIGIENIFLFSGLSFVAAGLFRLYLALILRNLKSPFTH